MAGISLFGKWSVLHFLLDCQFYVSHSLGVSLTRIPVQPSITFPLFTFTTSHLLLSLCFFLFCPLCQCVRILFLLLCGSSTCHNLNVFFSFKFCQDKLFFQIIKILALFLGVNLSFKFIIPAVWCLGSCWSLFEPIPAVIRRQSEYILDRTPVIIWLRYKTNNLQTDPCGQFRTTSETNMHVFRPEENWSIPKIKTHTSKLHTKMAAVASNWKLSCCLF